jgi:hypothetical protein
LENFDSQLCFQKQYVPQSITLNTRSDSFFDRDGTAIHFAQNLLPLGYVVTGYDLHNGNEDEAKHASTKCAYSTVVTGAAVIASIQYPLVSAIATPLTIVSEEKITTHVNNPNICGKFAAETPDRFAGRIKNIYEYFHSQILDGIRSTL